MTTATTKQKPAHKLTSGALTVSIWRNESKKVGTWFSVTATRSYQKDEQWADSGSFGQDDLLRLAKLLDEADSWIQRVQQAERQKKAA